MAPWRRFKRAARAEPAPGPADEAGPAAQETEAPQAAQSLHRLNRDWHIAGDLVLLLPYTCLGATDAVHGRGRFWACHPASELRFRCSTPVNMASPDIFTEPIHARDELTMLDDALAPRRRVLQEPRPRTAGPARGKLSLRDQCRRTRILLAGAATHVYKDRAEEEQEYDRQEDIEFTHEVTY
ncbi:hypothetical protein PIB30_011411 [Stylosanthes scabra]|uniref:Uncharacterized protein n=1 Tax=Stylosanthes scabra TaxID=79078 RepID=A0ABU6Z2H6_9FABA|nr:hypothetical protein [Stylosanthes scabra]